MSGVLETDALQQVVERLAREFLPCAIYLFGSHATGHAKPDSDVDLLVVLEDDSGWLSALGRRGYAAVRPIELPIELHFRSRAQFERWSEVAGSFEQEVRRTGRRLYNMSPKIEVVTKWLQRAREDLASCRQLLAGPDRIPNTACFHAQQAVEKALKAYLAWRKEPASRIHEATPAPRSPAKRARRPRSPVLG